MALLIVILIVAIMCLVVGLSLSNAGPSGGLASLAGQDLELFKKTKDRGLTKGLQVVMFMITILLIILVIVAWVI